MDSLDEAVMMDKWLVVTYWDRISGVQFERTDPAEVGIRNMERLTQRGSVDVMRIRAYNYKPAWT